MTKKWKRWAVSGGLVAVGVLVMVWRGCDPFDTQFRDVEPAERYRAKEVPEEPPEAGGALKVMTWNIKFGGGRIRFFFECPGDRVIMKRSEVIDNLEGLAAKIRQVDPDILMLQEIDVDSKRVAGFDQLQWLLDHTGLTYGVYASQWRAS